MSAESLIPPGKMPELAVIPSSGTGDRLPVWLLALCGSFTVVATAVSIMSITLQLKNYRKPALQRAVVRIMVMVPLYAISSFIAIFSLEAAFFIDAVRDLYEAFVIYTFLQLLITYLGGERSLLIILNGRPPIPHTFPINLFLRPMDVSDPWTLLNLKRGVLQYVQIKPLLVLATSILKVTGTYCEGDFSSDSGYTYISVIYNTSICLSLYCLAMFWVAVNKDLKPFRPVPKFLCVKGILFFSFWQSIGVSLLATTRVIKQIGPYTDAEHISLALTDSLICFEMPLFAIGHQYAFQASDYIDHNLIYAARLPFIYALRDAFGLKDVWEDTKDTLRGRGISYQAYEPAEGAVHHDIGRQRRIRAGLRYSKGGKAKYWLRLPGEEARHQGTNTIGALRRRMDERLAAREGYAPLLPHQAAEVVHDDPDDERIHTGGLFESDSEESDAPSLEFQSEDDDDNVLYERARRIGYAGFPNVDVSQEEKKRKRWQEEDGILAGKWSRGGSRERVNEGQEAGGGKAKGKGKGKGKSKSNGSKPVYGAWADRSSPVSQRYTDNVPNNDDRDGRVYDGDNERLQVPTPSGGKGKNKSLPNGRSHTAMEDAQLRWTKNRITNNGEDEDEEGTSFGSKLKTKLHLKEDRNKSNENEDPKSQTGPHRSKSPLPPDAVDLVIDDAAAIEAARTMHRADSQNRVPTHIYRHTQIAPGRTQHHDGKGGETNGEGGQDPEVEEVYDDGTGGDGPAEMLSEDEEPVVGTEELLERIEKEVESENRDRSRAQGRKASAGSGQGGWRSVSNPYGEDNPWA